MNKTREEERANLEMKIVDKECFLKHYRRKEKIYRNLANELELEIGNLRDSLIRV